MKVMTTSEAESWAAKAGVERDLRGDLAFRHGTNLRTTVPLPDKSYRIPYLANLLVKESYDSSFVESLLWFTGWGVADELSNRVGFKLLQGMHFDPRPLLEAPARLFGPTELVEAQSLLVLPILMGWDAYFLPAHGKYYVFTSNDEFIDVVSCDEETHRRFLAALKDGWSAKPW
jgi:hypothetical protein